MVRRRPDARQVGPQAGAGRRPQPTTQCFNGMIDKNTTVKSKSGTHRREDSATDPLELLGKSTHQISAERLRLS